MTHTHFNRERCRLMKFNIDVLLDKSRCRAGRWGGGQATAKVS
jgi:hypothetical protein